MSVQDCLIWCAVGALVFGFSLKEAYDAGANSKSMEIADFSSKLEAARGNVTTLEQQLVDANQKVLKFQAGVAADEKVKAGLQEQGKTDAAAGKARVEAAKTITTSTDDVLRKYWEAK